MKKFWLFALFLAVSGCADKNPYSIYYNDEGVDRSEFYNNEPVTVIETLDAETTLKEFYKSGYILLGTSSFKSEWSPFSKAIDTAKNKGASVVVLNTDVIGSVRKNFTMAIPQTDTTYHTGTVNTYGTYGNAYSNYYGTSTSTSYDYYSRDYDVTKFQQHAYFLARKINQTKED